MTSAATVAGHAPLVFADGPGAGARNSIGIMLVSGMVIGTVFTLFIVPSIYMLVARTRARVVEATSDDELAAPNGAAGLQTGRSRADLKVGPSIA
jgi:multidrug efflux pump